APHPHAFPTRRSSDLIRSAVKLQEANDALYCIVDQHAITGHYDIGTLSKRTRDMAIGLLAAGIDPSRATLFVQSHVPQHATLARSEEHTSELQSRENL